MGASFGVGAPPRARRRAVMALPLVLALLTVGLGLARTTPAGAAGSGALIPWAPESENPSSNLAPVPPARAMQDAANFNYLTAHVVAYAGEVPAMKQVNPKLRVLAYMNAAFAQAYQGTAYPEADYSHDAAGHKITNIKSGNFLMDPSNPDWIGSRITECENNVKQSGYDGCFLDLLGAAPIGQNFVTAQPINTATGMQWTRQQWLGATAHLAAMVQSAVHAFMVYGHPILVFGNGLSDGEQYYQGDGPSSVLVNSLDGCIAEAWLRQQDSPVTYHPTVSQWQQNVNMISDVEGKGKPLLVISKLWVTATQAQGDAWRQFALATYLMGTQGTSAFFFSYGFQYDRTTPLPWYQTALGAPSGAYGPSSSFGVFQRKFATGFVLVNVDSKPHTVTLGGTYYSLTHQPMTSATMAPGSGLILTTT